MKKFWDLDITKCAMTHNEITGWAYRFKDGFNHSNVLHTGPHMPLDSLMNELMTVDTFHCISDIPGIVAYVVHQSTGGAPWNLRIATVGEDDLLHPTSIAFEDFLIDRTGNLIFTVQLFTDYTLAFKVGA